MSGLPSDFSAAPRGDFVLPFDIAKAGVRGRLVRLDLARRAALPPMRCRKPRPGWP